MKKFYLLALSFTVFTIGFGLPNLAKRDTVANEPEKKAIAPKKTSPPKKCKPLVLKEAEIEKENINFLVPIITATKTVTVQGGGNPIPGSQLNYSVVINNAGTVANGVTFTDVLISDLTLVAGTVKASPIAVNDAYNCIGNVGITVPAVSGLLINDSNPIAANALTITAYDAISVNNGTVTITTSGANAGECTYTPAPGFNGTDTFTYTIDNGSGITNTSRTATVTITVSTPIWFINAAYVGNGSNGTMAKPFTTINAFQAINDAANTNRGENGDFIFVNSSNYSSSALTLRNTQKLIGKDATSSIPTITGVSTPTFSNALPSTGGTTVTIANTTATPITLGSGNEIQGCTVTSTSGTTMSGANVGALKVRETVLSATAGQALQITAGGVLDVQFKSISAAGANKGISVNSSTGSFQILGTGTTAGSGGTINNIANRGAEFVTCASITLKNMNFTSANTSTTFCANPASDNSSCNAALHLQSISTAATLDNISITGTTRLFGLNINNVTGLSLSNSTITSAGSTNAQGSVGTENGGIYAINLAGTSSINNTNVNSSFGRNFHCRNNSGTLSLSVTSCQFKDGFVNSSGGSNFDFEGYGTSNNTLVIKSSNFSNPKTYGLYLAFGNSSVNNVQVGGNSGADGNTITAAASSPGSNGFALQGANTLSGSIKYNVLNNNSQSSFNGVDIFNIGNSGSGTMEGRCNFNTATAVSTVNSNGIYIAQYGLGTHKAEVLNNTVSGTKNYGIGVESNDNSAATTTGRVDATVKNNNVTMINNSYSHFGVISVTNSASGAAIKTCANVGNNTTNDPVTGLRAGQLDVLAQNSGTSTSQVILKGNTVFVPGVGNQSTPLTTFWNANNVGVRTALDEGGGGTIIAGTCLTPSNPAAARIIASTTEIEKTISLVTEEENEKDLNVDLVAKMDEIATKLHSEGISITQFENSVASIESGETIIINGAGSGFLLPSNKSTTITFNASVSLLPSSCSITYQVSVSGSNFTTVNSNTITTNLIIPRSTALNAATSICNGQSISLTATCSSGTVQWYNAATTSILIGTGSPFVQSPIINITYQASCLVGGCPSAKVNTGLITVNPLPVPAPTSNSPVCAGNTLNLTSTGTGTFAWAGPNSFSSNIQSPSIIGVTTAASGTYTLTVTNSSGCSSSATTAVTINPANLNLVSPANDFAAGVLDIKATQTISASNKILSTAKIGYQAGKSILLSAGFESRSGSVFKAEIGGCSN